MASFPTGPSTPAGKAQVKLLSPRREDGSMQSDIYNVVIVGAGPAGATAATLLAKKGHRVAMIDRATFPRDVICAGWLSARSVPLLGELEVKAKPLLKHPFRDVTLYRADFTQSAKPVFEDAPGYLVDRAQFDSALVAAAVRQGVDVFQGTAAENLQLKEASVTIELADEKQVEGRLLLLAAGRNTELLQRVGLSVDPHESPIWTAQVEAPLSKQAAPKKPRVGVILGLEDPESFGICCLSTNRMSVGVNWVGDSSGAIPALVDLCHRAFENKILPLDLSDKAGKAKLISSPAAAALDRESHVGKHTLVIGDSGGFIAAASNEGIYPAMWSAQIAVEVADKALHSVHSQDELISFDSAWRMQMADYLRSPHTDIQFLLPLVFTNQPMADRMGAAFFCGENI